MQEVNSALSKIQLVGYSQKIVSVDTFVSAFMRATRVLSSWGLVALLVKLPCHLCAHPRKKRMLATFLHPPCFSVVLV